MPSIDDIRESLNLGNTTLWLFIATAVATLLTIQTVESAIEVAWPHQRRTARLLPGQRRAMPVWGIAGLLVLAGGLLALMSLGVILWRDVDSTSSQRLGGILLAAAWVVFLLASLNWLGMGRVIRETGMIGPLALCALLLAADLLLLIAFIDIVPEFNDIWDAIKDLIPFVGGDS
jgi:hypothetical protein